MRYDREVGDASPGAASPVAPAPPGDVQASLDGLKQCLEEQSSNKGDTAELLDCTLKAMGEVRFVFTKMPFFSLMYNSD